MARSVRALTVLGEAGHISNYSVEPIARLLGAFP